MQPDQLWAPWRMTYIRQLGDSAPPASSPSASSQGGGDATTPASGLAAPAGAPHGHAGLQPAPTEPPPCFLCHAAGCAPDSPDAQQQLVVHRDARGLIMLNRYPYTSGHLLVAVAEHLPDLTDLAPAQRAGLMELVALAQDLLRLVFNPQGMNIGINLGRCAGAGLPGHLHVHLVPRWNGDTNFMQTVGSVRVIPQALEESWRELKQAAAKARST